ncbi:MAG: zinc-binding dehydrogenase [Cyclobacteriaceae bacterium]|nr:zinc-binding dehydrogenase [Cyclobacteriaceae bacterium]
MKAYSIEAPGEILSLEIQELPEPWMKKDEVLVKIKAIGLNPVDYKLIERGYSSWKYPHIPGVDGAGIIIDAGELCNELKPGERVFFHTNLSLWGTFAEFVAVPAHGVSKIPDEVSFESAAALPCAAFTAYQALNRKIHIKSGDVVLIHGGSGGVGSFAVQISKNYGARVISTCSAAHSDFVKNLGADWVLDYNTDINEAIMKITDGRGVDVCLNTAGRQSATDDIDRIAFNGHLAHIAGAPDPGKIFDFTQALSIHEIALGGAWLAGDIPSQIDLSRMGDELMRWLAEDKLKPNIGLKVSFEELPKALEALKKRMFCGKAVVVMDA